MLVIVLFVFKMFFNVYFWERERERGRVRAGEGQRDRKTQNPKQAPGSELSAQNPTWGSNSWTEIMVWAEVRRLTDWASQVPQNIQSFIHLRYMEYTFPITSRHLGNLINFLVSFVIKAISISKCEVQNLLYLTVPGCGSLPDEVTQTLISKISGWLAIMPELCFCSFPWL